MLGRVWSWYLTSGDIPDWVKKTWLDQCITDGQNKGLCYVGYMISEHIFFYFVYHIISLNCL